MHAVLLKWCFLLSEEGERKDLPIVVIGIVDRYGDISYIKPINGISVCPSGIPKVERYFGIWMRQWPLQEVVYICLLLL
jgi:hypothetical protein